MKDEIRNAFGSREGVRIVIPCKGWVKNGKAILYGKPGMAMKHRAYQIGKKLRMNGRTVFNINEHFIFMPTENLAESVEQLKMHCWNMKETILIPNTDELEGIEKMDLSDKFILCRG